MQTAFNLLDDEKIVQEMKPTKGLLWQYLLRSILAWFFILLFVGGWIIFPVGVVAAAVFGIAGVLALALTGIIFLILLIVLSYVFAALAYGKRYYWITNQRVVVKSGLIGWKVNSIPYERMADVIVTRSFVERIFGTYSVHIQTLAGQYSPGGKFGAEGDLLAVQDPEALQKTVFELIKKKRKDERLSF